MTDVAAANGHTVDVAALEQRLGVPVRPVQVSKNAGLDDLRGALAALPQTPPAAPSRLVAADEAAEEVAELSELLQVQHGTSARQSATEAVGLLMADTLRPEERDRWSPAVLAHLEADKANLSVAGD